LPDVAAAPLFDAVAGWAAEAVPSVSGSAAAVVVAGDSIGFASGVLASAVAGGVADVVAEPPSVAAGEVEDAVAGLSEVAGASEEEATPSVSCGAVAVFCPIASAGLVEGAAAELPVAGAPEAAAVASALPASVAASGALGSDPPAC
jgi:hypothetical protein